MIFCGDDYSWKLCLATKTKWFYSLVFLRYHHFVRFIISVLCCPPPLSFMACRYGVNDEGVIVDATTHKEALVEIVVGCD